MKIAFHMQVNLRLHQGRNFLELMRENLKIAFTPLTSNRLDELKVKYYKRSIFKLAF